MAGNSAARLRGRQNEKYEQDLDSLHGNVYWGRVTSYKPMCKELSETDRKSSTKSIAGRVNYYLVFISDTVSG